jgi:hypothetical protein
MQYTIELPQDLAHRLQQYLEEHPGETLEHLVQEALEIRLAPKNLDKLLSLAGIVADASHDAANHGEAETTRPQQQLIDWKNHPCIGMWKDREDMADS